MEGGSQSVPTTIERNDLRLFAGPRSEKFLLAYDLEKDPAGMAVSLRTMIWSAVFLTLPWLLYRKLYLPAAVLLASIFLAGLLFDFFPVRSNPFYMILSIAKIGVCMAGASLYVRKALKAIEAINALELPPERRLQLISERGGTSLMLGLSALPLMLFVFYAGLTCAKAL